MTKNDKKVDEDILEKDETVVTEDSLPGVESAEPSFEDVPSEDEGEVAEETDWESRYKRALADYQNLEKRSHEQRREWILSSNKELLLRILPVLDTLMLARQHSEDKSLEVSVQQFLNVLKSEGVTKIEAVGQDFNPHTMEAVATGEGEEGKVLSEVQAGYMIHDKLLRPALVTVGKAIGDK